MDLKEIVATSTLEIWAQKIDGITYGAHTGGVLPEALVEDGAIGAILNHSENRFSDLEKLKDAHKRAKEVGLKTLIFAKDIEDLSLSLSLSPDFISYDHQSTGSDVSVASAKPEIIAQAVEIANKAGIPLIVGAGVHSSEDVRKCIELGASGIAVASDVMKAEDPKKELLDLVKGFTA
jgi:triosephosphate isomerase